MNGAECGSCGFMLCRCEEIERRERRRQCKDEKDLIEQVFQILMKPKGLRLKILRWLYPEVVRVADSIKKYYRCNLGQPTREEKFRSE